METGLGIVGAFVASFFLPRGFEVVRREPEQSLPFLNIPVLPMPVETVRVEQSNVRDKTTEPSAFEHQMLPLMERRPPAPKVLKPARCAEILVRYLQDSKATGVYAAEEIDEAWLSAAEALHIYALSPQTIRAELEGLGLLIGRKQLRLMYPEVAIRTGRTRATLYSIPARTRSASRHPRQNPDDPAVSRSIAGQRPGSGGNSTKNNSLQEAA